MQKQQQFLKLTALFSVFIAVILLAASCATAQRTTASSPDAPTTPELSFEEQHRETLRLIYDTFPELNVFTRTREYREEYNKHFSEEKGELIANDTYFIKTEEIDPFSERLLPMDTPQKIEPGMTYGEIVRLFGIPNHSIMGLKDSNDSHSDAFFHIFYYLEDGTILRVVLNGVVEFKSFIDEYTTYEYLVCEVNWVHNFYAENCDVLSVQEMLGQKEYYVDLWKKWLNTDLDPYQWDPRGFGSLWHWDDWPEIFVTKYGFPETYVPADDGNDG